MSHTLGMRAASLGTSAALLGLAVIAAFSISVRLIEFDPGGETTITTFTERPKEPPPPVRPIVRQRPPPTAQEEATPTDAPVADPLPQPIEFGGPVTFEAPLEITNPRWLRRPRDLGVYYPQRAETRGVTGEVELDCLVSTVGRLDCSIISETPRNWGFGQAALAISRDHRMAPATENGVAVQGRYRMRVPFEVQ